MYVYFYILVRGTGPSARCNHVAALYDDKSLLVFGGTSKSKSLNDLYSLDFETVSIKITFFLISSSMKNQLTFNNFYSLDLCFRWCGQELRFGVSIHHLDLVVVESYVEQNGILREVAAEKNVCSSKLKSNEVLDS